MKRLIVVFAICGLLLSALSATNAEATETISFTADYVKTVLAGYNATLHITNNEHGISDIRVMPVLTSGTFTLTGGSTTATNWVAQVPGTYTAMDPYIAGKFVQFHANLVGNNLYLISDDASPAFPSYQDGGGTEYVNKLDDNSTFSFSFDLTTGSTWTGAYQFLVDGQRYDTTQYIGFTGGLDSYSLLGNTLNEGHAGYQVAGSAVPLPSTLLLLGSGLGGLLAFGRRQWLSR